MKRTFTLIAAAAITFGMQAQAIYKDTKYHAPIKVEKKWKDYNPGDVEFHDEAPESEGSRIYHSIIPNPVPYIQENALRVLQTLYYGPKDSNVPRLKRIVYTIKDYNGISEKYNLGASFGGALFLGVATSLPELTSTINLARKKNFQAAYSDLIGSCIFNFLILTFSDALSFDCRSSVYRFDQSAFMMIVFGAVEFVALLIGLILLIKGVDGNKIQNRIIFYALGTVLVASYIAFIVLSNVDLAIPFAPFIK